jgi:hypothetical protein
VKLFHSACKAAGAFLCCSHQAWMPRLTGMWSWLTIRTSGRRGGWTGCEPDGGKLIWQFIDNELGIFDRSGKPDAAQRCVCGLWCFGTGRWLRRWRTTYWDSFYFITRFPTYSLSLSLGKSSIK